MLKAPVQPERDAVIHLFPVLGRARFLRHVLVRRPAEQVPKVVFSPRKALDSVGQISRYGRLSSVRQRPELALIAGALTMNFLTRFRRPMLY